VQKAIYKITNKINNKIYIGQTNNPERRFSEHITGSDQSCSLIHRAIVKYGSKNFTFEILGWFENWQEQERYYINFYRTLAPYGYNIHEGGNEPPHYSGEQNSNAKITQATAYKVQEQALNWNIPRKQIVKDNKITFDIFRHINEGTAWRRDDLNYPLRPDETYLNNLKVEKIIKLLKTTTLSHRDIAKQVGWSKSAVTMINIGANHRQENETYPIRK